MATAPASTTKRVPKNGSTAAPAARRASTKGHVPPARVIAPVPAPERDEYTHPHPGYVEPPAIAGPRDAPPLAQPPPPDSPGPESAGDTDERDGWH